MKDRCYRESDAAYARYGGRGIKMCDDWLDSFVSFEEWAVNNGYTENLTLDRIDVNKGYSPENCRWATWLTQANNQTRNHYVTYNEETKTVAEWAREKGLAYNTLCSRLTRYGWSIEDALETPSVDNRKKPNK